MAAGAAAVAAVAAGEAVAGEAGAAVAPCLGGTGAAGAGAGAAGVCRRECAEDARRQLRLLPPVHLGWAASVAAAAVADVWG